MAYHSLDQAACVLAILEARPLTLERGALLLRLETEESKRLLVTLGALHDIGKFSESFFGQTPDLWPMVQGAYVSDHHTRPHTAAGYALWRRVLRDRFGERLSSGATADLDALAAATFGHHGRPLLRGPDAHDRKHFRRAGTTDAAVAFADDVISLLSPSPARVPEYWASAAERGSWWVAGLISIADWMASAQTSFPYQRPTLGIADYWEYAKQRASEEVVRCGLVPPKIGPVRSFAVLAGQERLPTPVQRWALDFELPAGPALFIIEDVTGSGKTEAAQVLVNKLMAGGRASGAYWGMPTQATANAMFTRQRVTIGALFEMTSTHRPSLIVAHAQTKLHNEFQKLVFESRDAPVDIAADVDDEAGSSGEVACAAFIADDRRKAFLADVGAGTVDQALLGVLPSKFNTIRLFGLAEKVLVLDEVHAYDAYVACEIEALLEFHAALGGSAILLSATLTERQRRRFVETWRAACGALVEPLNDAEPPDPKLAHYPLATVVDGQREAASHDLQAADWSYRRVGIVPVSEVDEVVRRIVEAEQNGQAVAWIRNTVDSVIEAAELLRASGLNPLVFHSRFAQSDRQRIEQEVIDAFGEKSTGAKRERVLVASQVVEQSLDLDFDLLVSDLAPVDLLIQRAGRLWRHKRTRPLESRMELLLLAPPYEAEPGDRWLDAVLPKTKFVYEDLGVLWRTQRELSRVQEIVTPSDVRLLVESVYADDTVPKSLEAASQRARDKSAVSGMVARHFSLEWTRGYCAGSSTNWYADIRVPTRLAEEKTVVRLARLCDDGRLEPWSTEGDDAWKRWALSEVRVSEHRIGRHARVAKGHAAGIEAIRATWPKYERDVLVVVLEPDGEELRGEYIADGGSVEAITYSPERGLLF